VPAVPPDPELPPVVPPLPPVVLLPPVPPAPPALVVVASTVHPADAAATITPAANQVAIFFIGLPFIVP
jgi:hypothetical protein